jgi:hypothetical protein
VFGSQNQLLEWNDYSIGITIPLFGRVIFLGIAIPLGRRIAIPEGIDNIFFKKIIYIYFF